MEKLEKQLPSTNIKGIFMQLNDNIINDLQSYYEAATTKHPELHPISHRLLHIVEEVGETAKELNDYKDPKNPMFGLWNVTKVKMRTELFQVAVTALRTITENIDEDNVG